jgi:hypothetical protein
MLPARRSSKNENGGEFEPEAHVSLYHGRLLCVAAFQALRGVSFVTRGYLPTMCGASLSMQTYSPISSLVSRSATLLMTQGFE